MGQISKRGRMALGLRYRIQVYTKGPGRFVCAQGSKYMTRITSHHGQVQDQVFILLYHYAEGDFEIIESFFTSRSPVTSMKTDI